MTVRLAMIYSLLAGRGTIEADDLKAALAAWQYCRDSALFLFGDTPADRRVTKIMAALEGGALTKTEIRATVFSNHIPGHELDDLITQMESDHLITVETAPPRAKRER